MTEPEQQEAELLKADTLVLSPEEQTWLLNQARKARGSRSKFVPHQGAREKARRLKQVEATR